MHIVLYKADPFSIKPLELYSVQWLEIQRENIQNIGC